MNFCSLGINSTKYWLFLLGSITFVVRKYTFSDDKLPTPGDKYCVVYSKTLYMGIGMSLSIFVYLISKSLSGSQRRTTIFKDPKQKIDHAVDIGVIILAAILDCGGFIFSINSNPEYNGSDHIHYITQLIFAALGNIFWLKILFHKHHFVFSLVILIGFIILLFSNFAKNKVEFEGKSLLVLIDGVSDGVRAVMMKWMIQKRFMSPIALPGSIIFSLILIITHENCHPFLSDLLYNIHMIVFIIFSMGYNLFIFLIIDYFGPTHRVVMELFSTFIVTVINIGIIGENDIEPIEGILLFIGHIVILFGVIGFNEIIVLGCFGLDYNTRVIINKRLLDSEENAIQMCNTLDTLNEKKNKENNWGIYSESEETIG